MVYFYDEGNFVGVFSGGRSQHSKCRSYGVASAFDGKLDNVLRIKAIRILSDPVDKIGSWQVKVFCGVFYSVCQQLLGFAAEKRLD